MTEITRQNLRPCACCGKGVLHTGVPLAWRVTVERIAFDRNVIAQQAGLEAMFGGSAAAIGLADVFAPGPIGRTVDGTSVDLLVCETCAVERALPVGVLAELRGER